MTQTWTGTDRPWMVRIVVAASAVTILLMLGGALLWASPAMFREGSAASGLATLRVVAVVLSLLFAWVIVRIVQANTPNTVTLTEGAVTVRNHRGEHTMKLADVDAIVYVTTSVQSGSGLFFYPREEYLAAAGSKVDYGNADPDMTISLQRFSDHDERECALALREAIKAAGGRFGTSTGPRARDEEHDNVTRTDAGRLRVAKPVVRRDETPGG